MGIFPARERKREKKRETVELCQLLVHRALPELGHDLSHAHLLLGSPSGAWQWEPRQKRMHRNTRLQKAKRVKPFISLIWFSEWETWLSLPFQGMNDIWQNSSSTEQTLPVRSVFLIMLRRCQITGSPPRRPKLFTRREVRWVARKAIY